MTQILIVDDQPSNRELLHIVFERQGHLIAEAGDGDEALRKIQEQATDLVLLDITMPNINGYEVLKKIRSDQRLAALLVVAVTANAMRGDREKILSAGFNGYVSKPICVASLRKEVDRLLLNVIRDAA
jgi:CheY-like chemotaxis protein